MIPRWLRKKTYERMLETAHRKEIFLCWAVKKYFPYFGIRFYPELWNRRNHASGTCLEPFITHTERVKFLEEALELLNKKDESKAISIL